MLIPGRPTDKRSWLCFPYRLMMTHYLKTIVALLLLVICGCAHAKHAPVLNDPAYRVMATERDDTFIVQVPNGRTIHDFLKEIGCGENYICSVSDAGTILIIQRKRADKPKGSDWN
jgi:hypothetical protein